MDEDTNRSYQQCSQQVQGRQFRACQRYLQQRSSGPYNAGDEEEDEEVAGNPQQQYLQECCQQLKEMDRQQCGCEAIRHAVREAQHGQGGRSYHTGQSEQIYQRARALPRRCRLTHQQCRFSVVFV
ncbi:hypothetical protein C2S53_018261 [Perilla frutescens var. hirtella]|uniref:Bifunctional inhibitor/plant lipid transfer protein/seed storage helical domain-containing protein n=1 Tax=Perilla frutescens var. hirtella TaxID=608512 RepID=A0AAD4JNP1_PERFH|nr:hypothetical protein C2S53_018261 [Perilla frutescens var. hirtella]